MNTSIESQDKRIHFAPVQPHVLSTVWSDGTDVWLLPVRGVFIQKVTSLDGKPLVLDTSGAYFKLPNGPSSFIVEVGNKPYAVDLKNLEK